MLQLHNRIPRDDLFLGIVYATGIDAGIHPPAFDQGLKDLIKERGQELTPAEEALRKRARDVLRNGKYKPTGRGKPASEYLIRRAREAEDAEVPHDAFPRVNAPVDCCNFISLRHLYPISMWDLDRAGAETFVFRLGAPDESYVFNESGQRIELQDLVVGCRSRGSDDSGEPIVNPVKDSMGTKTGDDTTPYPVRGDGIDQVRRGGVVAPVQLDPRLTDACEDFAALLAGCGSEASTRFGVVAPGSRLDI